jgi:hypothetical protein
VVAGARDRLSAFPDELSMLRGDEPERLDAWSREVAASREAMAEAGALADRAAADLERAGGGEEGIPVAVLAGLEERLDGLRRLDADVARATTAAAAARARRERAAGLLGAAPPAGAGHGAAAAGAEALDQLIRRAESLRARRAALEERLGILVADGAREAEEAGEADAAVRVLRRWLAAGPEGAGGEARLRVLLATAIGGLAGVGLVVALLGGAVLTVVGAAALVLAGVLLALRPARLVDPRPGLEREAARLGQAPALWSRETVEARLEALERQAAAERVAAERWTEAERLKASVPALEAEEAALEAGRAALLDALGLAPPAGDLALHLAATRFREWEEAAAVEAAALGEVGEAEAGRSAALSAAAAAVAPFGCEVPDTDGLAGALKELRARRERHQSAVAALAGARERFDRASRRLAEVERERATLLERLGLGAGEEHRVRAWCERLESYHAARQDLEQAERRWAEAREALETASPGAGALVADAPVAVLESELESATAAAEAERKLAERIAGIEARLAQAREKHDVEEALARVAAAQADVAAQRERDMEAEVGGALAAWLRERVEDQRRPAVFHRARDLFRLITRGRYRLDLAEGGGAEFRAYDHTTHRGHGLDELSSGTRLQLLLAVRVAFVELEEKGPALPLLLDEVLANCDDDRAAAIMDAAIAIAGEGRQVFYFTAQGDELAKWRARLGAQEAVNWCVRGVLDVAGAGGAALDWTPAAREEVPSPGGMDHAAYGRALRVPPFDPWADGVGGLHLWYLVDDVEVLYRLLVAGIHHWGQLEALAAAGGDAGLAALPPEVVERARRAAGLCDRFRQLWRQGRGRPVDRAVLAESGAVTDTFLDRVAGLCRELEGAGEPLVRALAGGRVPRFRTAQAEELRAFLLERGYLPEQEPLSADRILGLVTDEAERTAPDLEPAVVVDLVHRLARGPGR